MTNIRPKNTQNLRTCYEHTEAEKRRRTFILTTAQDNGNNLFCGYMFTRAITSPLILCMYKFVLNLSYLLLNFFLADQGSG